jgi:hypothetical protein
MTQNTSLMQGPAATTENDREPRGTDTIAFPKPPSV